MKEFRDRQYGITTSELRCEDFDHERYDAQRKKAAKESEARELNKLRESIFIILENAMNMKENKLIGKLDNQMKAAVGYLIVNSDIDKFKKVDMLCEYGVDFASDEAMKMARIDVNSSPRAKYELISALQKVIDIDVPFNTGYSGIATIINAKRKDYMMEQMKVDGIKLSPTEVSKLINYGYLK